MPTRSAVVAYPTKASAASEAKAPPRIHGLRRPLRSERAPAIGLKAVAKTALIPPITPSTATLSAGSISAT